MKKKIGIAGNILLDVVKKIECWPELGMLVNIGSVSHAVGGCVCNTATDLKRLDDGISVSVFGRIGKDEYGDLVLRFMEESGLDVSAVVRSEKLPTSFTDVMTLPSGERTFFHARGANAEFSGRDVSAADGFDLFHLGYLLLLDELDSPDEVYGTRAARLLADVRSRGVKTSIDLVSAQTGKFKQTVIPSLPHCDYVVVNEIEGGLLTDVSPRDDAGKPITENLRTICERLLALGVNECAVIHCPELSCAMDRTGFYLLPSLALPKGYIVGSVGAGDAFCAGMLYSFANGIAPLEGMHIASCAAACNLSAADSVGGARPLNETLKLEKEFGRRNIC